MKKLTGFFLLFAMISLGQIFCASLSPERMACEQACKTAKDDCIEDAKDDGVKKAACEVTCKKCLKECG